VSHARFTVLAFGLIRMEFSQAGSFEDRASQTFGFAGSQCQSLP
jgi:hypothetical protein